MMKGAPSDHQRLKRSRWQAFTSAGLVSNTGAYIAAAAGIVASKTS
jgi:hypothetical protein